MKSMHASSLTLRLASLDNSSCIWSSQTRITVILTCLDQGFDEQFRHILIWAICHILTQRSEQKAHLIAVSPV
jgi:hypothetical protein